MATTKKAAAAPPDKPKPLTPDEAVKQAVETVRAPFEAIRAAQAEVADEQAGSKGD